MIIYIPDVPVGKKFGRLTVLGIGAKSESSRQYRWKCACDCGVNLEIFGSNIKRGMTTSCGCLQKEKAGTYNTTHGKSGTKIHKTWKGIKQRCLNPKNPNFPDYGGRGITICDSWKNSFEEFYKFMGEPPSPDHSIDRIDNDKGYEPGNVRWETNLEQVRNRRISVFIEMDGRRHLKKTCDELGVNYFNAYDMIVRRKINPSDAFALLRDSKEPSTSG